MNKIYTGALAALCFCATMLFAGQKTTIETDADVSVDRSVPRPDDDRVLLSYIASLPFARLIPKFPNYSIPTAADCDWIYEEGGARPGVAYREWLANDGIGVWTMGVRGDASNVRVGHGWGHLGDDTIGTQERTDPLRVRIVGLTEDAEMHLTIGDQWGQVESLGVFNIGCRGSNRNFIVSTITSVPMGDIIFDGCWWLNRASWSPGEYPPHTSGLHLGDYRSLIFRRHKYRGWLGREHCIYIKSSVQGPTWVVQNELQGGNRTWFQRRPQPSHNAVPIGSFIVLLNSGPSYGWDHGSAGNTFDGGSAITIWTAPTDRVFIAGNEVFDAKYGCLMIGGQTPERNWLNSRGFPIGEAWVWDNTLENHRGDRDAVAISAVQRLHMGPNKLLHGGQITFNNRWGMQAHGIRIGTILFHDASLARLPIRTYEDTESGRLYTVEEKLEWIVD